MTITTTATAADHHRKQGAMEAGESSGGGKEADGLLFLALQQLHFPIPEEVETIKDIVPRPELLVCQMGG